VVSVAPWSKRKVQAWVDDVRKELGLAIEEVEVDHGLDDEDEGFSEPPVDSD
jgi:3'-phosphoadenosine 5'-phosphosulfate sulfotransferase (PAPS reductase)/FAD synthetase